MPVPEDVIRLRHMLEAAEKVIEFAQACQRIDLDQDEKLALAVVRLIEIIGEAARHVTKTTQNQFTEVPWRQIAGTRDRREVDGALPLRARPRDRPAAGKEQGEDPQRHSRQDRAR